MLKLQKVNNGCFEEESALINAETKELILKGDYYHDNIDEYIEGFFQGLDYCKIEYERLKDIRIESSDKMFKELDFYYEDYYNDKEDEIKLEEESQYATEKTVVKTPRIEEVIKVEEKLLLPHEIKYNFEIWHDGYTRIYCDIVTALNETINEYGDLYLDDDIIYSCCGLELEDNNDSLKEFGVYYDEDNILHVIE